MGFNAMQPGKVRKADILYLLAALVAVVAMVAWAVR